jgi:hypothetical protein
MLEDEMRYLLLVYEDERQWDVLPASERDALVEACRDNDAALRTSGYLLAAESLHHSDGAATVQLHAGAPSVMEGILAQPQAQLRAVVTIRARDLNEAIQVAAMMPQTRLGPIEVRPIRS